MASYRVVEHTIPGQHIREYPHATTISDHAEEAVIKLAVKQYIPTVNNNDDDGNDDGPPSPAVTIVMAGSNGFPKETYEPFLEHLMRICGKKNGVRIRGIWAVDRSNQGASGVFNEGVQGDDPCWFDHSRDLLCMVNTFRPLRPIIGVGHSMGATELVNLSIIHPRLLSSLILIEPIIMTDHPPGPNAALASSFRQDLWPSRRAAEEALSKNKLFRSFHPKVLENYVRHGLRELPTQVYPDLPADYIAGAPRPVTLTTSKHQEVWTFIRSNFLSRGPVVDDGLRSTEQQDRVINPNADPETEVPLRFYRPECTITFKNLPYVRPTTYYIFGAKSPFSPPEARKEKQDQTGTGVGGSGGVQAGKVQSHVFENGNHFLPFVNVEALAEVVNVYLEQGLHNTVKEDTLWKNFDSQKSERDRLVVSKRWLEAVGQPTDAKRSVVSKL